jgi:hypothetical protein
MCRLPPSSLLSRPKKTSRCQWSSKTNVGSETLALINTLKTFWTVMLHLRTVSYGIHVTDGRGEQRWNWGPTITEDNTFWTNWKSPRLSVSSFRKSRPVSPAFPLFGAMDVIVSSHSSPSSIPGINPVEAHPTSLVPNRCDRHTLWSSWVTPAFAISKCGRPKPNANC